METFFVTQVSILFFLPFIPMLKHKQSLGNEKGKKAGPAAQLRHRQVHIHLEKFQSAAYIYRL